MTPRSDRSAAAGLFLATLATLLLEMLDSRLLSVLTSYHLAFLAVSVAMLGMAAGAVSAAAAGAAWAFHRLAGTGSARDSAALAVLLLAAAAANAWTLNGIGVVFAKGRDLRPGKVVEWSAWNTHSFVSISRASRGPAFYWGKGAGAGQVDANVAWVLIDGEAGTPITEWNGDRRALDWVHYDVTAVPYHLRRGDTGIIGVGGGRDILSAMWGRSTSITGIEINNNLVRALEGPYRSFAGIADQRDVHLVHGEARSYLSRTDQRFDVLQMSLIDTWAATGAGAFTLSENGLYTVEGWRVFLNTLKPGGIFSVSRWFSPQVTSETSRLLALGVAALLDRGVARPADRMVMVARGSVATLLVSNEPFTEADRARVTTLAGAQGFTLPWCRRGGAGPDVRLLAAD